MLQGFSGGYTMYHDTSFMIYITKLYRVALALKCSMVGGYDIIEAMLTSTTDISLVMMRRHFTKKLCSSGKNPPEGYALLF